MKRFISMLLCLLLVTSVFMPTYAATWDEGSEEAVSDFRTQREKEHKKAMTLREKLMALFAQFFRDMLGVVDKEGPEATRLYDNTMTDLRYWVRRYKK